MPAPLLFTPPFLLQVARPGLPPAAQPHGAAGVAARRALAAAAHAAATAALALSTLPVRADGDGGRERVPLLPAYVQECGACHVPFAPGLLPAASWQRVMQGLGRHHGSDASLDAGTTQTLARWLQAHAGSGKRGAEAPPDDRITRSAWFTREHREVAARLAPAARPASAAARATVAASDCAACHTRATEGSFREREIRLPR